jgi:Holliday junction resolvase
MTGGVRSERRFARFFDASGYAVLRSPASGSRTDRDQPDVFAARSRDRFAAEIKTVAANETAYLDNSELEQLTRFARRAESLPLVVVRWKQDRTFYLFALDDLDVASSTTRKATPDDQPDAIARLADCDDETEWQSTGDALSPDDVADQGVTLDTWGGA